MLLLLLSCPSSLIVALCDPRLLRDLGRRSWRLDSLESDDRERESWSSLRIRIRRSSVRALRELPMDEEELWLLVLVLLYLSRTDRDDKPFFLRRSIRLSFSMSFLRLCPAAAMRSLTDDSRRLVGDDSGLASPFLFGIETPRALALSCLALRALRSNSDRDVAAGALLPEDVRLLGRLTFGTEESGRLALRAAARLARRSAMESGMADLPILGTVQALAAAAAADSLPFALVFPFVSLPSPFLLELVVVSGGTPKSAERIPLLPPDAEPPPSPLGSPGETPKDKTNFVLFSPVMGLPRLNPWLLVSASEPSPLSVPSPFSLSFLSFDPFGANRNRTEAWMFLAHMFGRFSPRACPSGDGKGDIDESKASSRSSSKPSSPSTSLTFLVLFSSFTSSSFSSSFSSSSSSWTDGTYRSR
mmetsp:Transcript_10905/g.23103  ORF Transcript_10905/g.23103 Transcript_10905/m.23103 type:complete len:417 (+) Transcript_10905:290-1540(+)